MSRTKNNAKRGKRTPVVIGLVLIVAVMVVGGAMMAGGDGRDDNAINQIDRKLNCVGCHIPIRKTGQSPADVGAGHLTNVWAPISSDQLIHHMPVIDAERRTSNGLPREVVTIARLDTSAGADRDDEFGQSAAKAGLSYPRMIQCILKLAFDAAR